MTLKSMTKKNWFRSIFTICLSGGVLAAVGGDASAQAWVSEKGELAASANYTTGISDDLVSPDGETYGGEDLSIDNHTLTLGATYTPIENLGLSMSLPLLLVRYSGEQNAGFPPHGPYDDGDFHFTPTDLRFGARYQLFEGSKTVSPHFAVSIPTADYTTIGYAGAGRHIYKGHVGLSGGAVLDPWLDKAFVHLSAEFSFGTKPKVTDPAFEEDALDEFSQNYIDFEFTGGYFVTDKLTISGVVAVHRQLDGVTFDDVPLNDQNALLFSWHDVALKETYVHPGFDIGYTITPELSASAYFRMFVSGTNTRNLMGGGIGFNYTILTPDPPPIDDDWYEEEDWSEEDETEVEASAEE
jgi:hypothetical protein